MALHIRGDARCSLGDLAGGIGDLREALRMSSDAGFGMDTILSYSYLDEWLWLVEGPAVGLQENAKSLELGERRGLAALTQWTKVERTVMLFDSGDWDELLRLAREVLELGAEDSHVRAFAMATRSLVLVQRGRAEEAMSGQEDLLAEARRAEDLQVFAPALSAAARVAAASGRTYQAMALAEEFETATRDRSPVYREVQGLEVVRVCAEAGALEIAERILDSPPGASTRSRLSRRTAQAVMAEANGKRDQAAPIYAELEAGWGEYGHRLETGLAALGSGRCSGDRAALERAREIFESLAADPLLREAGHLLST